MNRRACIIFVLFVACCLVAGCTQQPQPGQISFWANGEQFVWDGLTTVDGWDVSFDHVYVTMADITGHQTDPPFDPDSAAELTSAVTASLPGVHTIDLVGDRTGPVLVGETTCQPGHYNAISWKLVNPASGPAAGAAVLITGTATRDSTTIQFTIRLDREVVIAGGEYVGEERKGILAAGGTADLEMTFHFDHLFGDADAGQDEDINQGALGFSPLAALADGDLLDIDLAGLRSGLSATDFATLEAVLLHLAHVGEGHCRTEAL